MKSGKLISRRMSGQQVSTRVLDCGIETTHPGNVPKRSHQGDSIRDSKIFPHHGIFMFVYDTNIIHISPTKEIPVQMLAEKLQVEISEC